MATEDSDVSLNTMLTEITKFGALLGDRELEPARAAGCGLGCSPLVRLGAVIESGPAGEDPRGGGGGEVGEAFVEVHEVVFR
jgi:hypothetical protein